MFILGPLKDHSKPGTVTDWVVARFSDPGRSPGSPELSSRFLSLSSVAHGRRQGRWLRQWCRIHKLGYVRDTSRSMRNPEQELLWTLPTASGLNSGDDTIPNRGNGSSAGG